MSWQGTWGHLTVALEATCDSTASGEMRSHLPFLQELALRSKTEEQLYPEVKGATGRDGSPGVCRHSQMEHLRQSRTVQIPNPSQSSQPVTVSTWPWCSHRDTHIYRHKPGLFSG